MRCRFRDAVSLASLDDFAAAAPSDETRTETSERLAVASSPRAISDSSFNTPLRMTWVADATPRADSR